MGEVMRFEAGRRRAPPPLPLALFQAGAAFWVECSAAWWRWMTTGR